MRPSRRQSYRDLERIFPGNSNLAGLMRKFDWSQTPLGPPERWPQSLRNAIEILLPSRAQIVLFWGPDFITFYNDAYAPVFGRKHPHALGLPARECWSEVWNDTLDPLFTNVMRSGEAFYAKDLRFLLERHGYLEEAYFDVSYDPVRDERGAVGGILCIVSETTGRVLGERRLRTLRDLGAQAALAKTVGDACHLTMGALTENQTDVPFALLYLLSSDGARITLSGATPGDVSQAWFPRNLDESVAMGQDGWRLAEVICTGKRVVLEGLHRRLGRLPNGPWSVETDKALVLPLATPGQERVAGVLVVGINPCRVLDEEYDGFLQLLAGHIATTIAHAHAYEQERERAEVLTELDRAKTAFFSNVSHEFRTPLTLMLGPIEEELRERPQSPRLEIAHRNSLRLLKLVNTLLDFSRIEAGRMQAKYLQTDLASFTSELAGVFRSAIEQAGLRLLVDCPPLPKPVYVDRDMWEKIVLNLLSNAFKFTFTGEIAISLRPEGGQVELCVRDTGIGIAPDELPKIFDRFHRVEGAQGRTHEGTGIGLALVQELAMMHGGTVQAESDPGKGSRFRVTIPTGSCYLPPVRIGKPAVLMSTTALTATSFVEEALQWLPSSSDESDTCSTLHVDLDATPGSIQHSQFNTQHSAKPRVLVADDNADMRGYIRRLLTEHYEVETARDGAAALAAARARRPDLILSDVMMPGLDGFGLLRALRDDPDTRTIPVMLLSARAGEETRIEGLEQGADDYLIKPFTARELLARVGVHVTLARIRRESAAAVRKSEQRFRHMADHAAGMVRVTDVDGSCSFLSKSWYEFTGQTPEDGLGLGWLHLVHPEDRDRSAKIFQAAKDTPERFRLDYRLRRKDGEYRWVMDITVPFVGETGEILGYTGSVIDITERIRQEEEQIRKAHQQSLLFELANAVNRAEALSDLYSKALEAIIISCNADRASILLFDEDGVMRFKAWRGISDGYRLKVEGDSPWQQDTFEPQPIVIGNITEAGLDRQLQMVIQEEGIQALGFIPLTYGGRLLGKFMVYFNRPYTMNDEDISVGQAIAGTLSLGIERKMADASLRKTKAALDFALESSEVGDWDLDLTSDVWRRSLRHDQCFGYNEPVKEWGFKRFMQHVHHEDRVRIAREFQAAVTHLSDWRFECRVVWPDGNVYWIAMHGSIYRSEEGKAIRMLGIVANITERKQAEEELRRFNVELEVRVAERTDELTQSQASLRALATELNLTEQRERKRMAMELHDYLAQLLALSKMKLRQGKRLAEAAPGCAEFIDQTDEMLTEALTYTRTLVVELSPPVLHDLGLPAALRWLAERMQQHRLAVTVHIESEDLKLPEDQSMLVFQSVRELLMNAAKYATSGRASITLAQLDGQLQISVRDDGPGFDLAAAAAAADVTIALSSKFGLYSIRERMRALGGRFELQSSRDEGTTAILALPLGGKEVRGSGRTDTAVTENEARVRRRALVNRQQIDHSLTGTDHSSGIRVLLVDDHAMVREGLRSVLESYPDVEIVGEACNGQEAVAFAERLHPAIIIMDINMPKMNGIEATAEITSRDPSIIVIGLSVNAGGANEVAMRNAGAAILLTKEAVVDELYRTILETMKAGMSKNDRRDRQEMPNRIPGKKDH
jgi:PAS domain S-box-containing protein